MNRITFVDAEIIDSLPTMLLSETDPDIATAVDSALKTLKPELREVIYQRYYEGRRVREIARNLNRSEKEITAMLYEAKRRLKIILADFVEQRWGIKVNGNCRICSHPSRKVIESILIKKKEDDSWRFVTSEIQKAVGERFHPPQILKAHLKHMGE